MNVRTQGLGFLCSLTALAGANPPAHEKPPTMPWIRPVREITQSIGSNHAACASHVTRDGYTSIQVNVDAYGCNITGDAANEPSIAIDPTDPKKIVIGWRQFDSVLSDFRQAGWAYSHDAGHTWVFQGSLTPGVFGSDPVLAAGPNGEIYYLSISEKEMRLFRSYDGGATWLPRTKVADGFWDKPWMSVDHTHGPGRGNIYTIASSYGFRSFDRGNSFPEPTPVQAEMPITTIGVDGALYIVDDSNLVSRANSPWDNSSPLTFELNDRNRFSQISPCSPQEPATRFFNDPNLGGLTGQDWIASEIGGPQDSYKMYALVLGECTGSLDLDIFVERSSDRGATWSPGKRVNDDPVGNGALEWFYMMSVGPNGRIDVVWNDTRSYPNPPEFSSFSELYYSYSTDQGDTWSSNVPASPVFNSWLGWPRQNKIGDYYHLLSDNLGVNVAYAATFNGEQDIYFLRIGPWDCNGNQVDDAQDISSGTSLDCNGNGVPDECEYRADFDGDGLTTYNDFAMFLGDFTGPFTQELVFQDASNADGGHGPPGHGPPCASEFEPGAQATGGASPLAKGGHRGVAPGAHASDSDLELRTLSSELAGCAALSDIDHDGDVDLKDFDMLQQVFVTP